MDEAQVGAPAVGRTTEGPAKREAPSGRTAGGVTTALKAGCANLVGAIPPGHERPRLARRPLVDRNDGGPREAGGAVGPGDQWAVRRPRNVESARRSVRPAGRHSFLTVWRTDLAWRGTRLARRLPPGPMGGPAKREDPSGRAISRRRDNREMPRDGCGSVRSA